MQPVYSSNSVIRHVDYLIAQGPSSYCRRSSRILSSVCRPAASNAKRKPSSLPSEGRIELDSHADTILLGANCVVLSHMGQTCEVMPYSDTYKAITDVPVVTGATLWISPHDGDEYILIFNEALWMGDTLQHTLVNPNLLRAYSTTVQDNPFSPFPLSFDPTNGPVIPLTTMGTIIYCTTRAPSDHNYPHCLTSSSPPLLLGIHTTSSSRQIVWRGENKTHIFHQFPPPHTISLQQFMNQRLSIQDWFYQSKSMRRPNSLKNCPPRQHFKAKVDTLWSLLKI